MPLKPKFTQKVHAERDLTAKKADEVNQDKDSFALKTYARGPMDNI